MNTYAPDAYRPAATYAPPMPHSQYSQMPPMPSARAPMPEQQPPQHSSDGLAPLKPGSQPATAEPLSRSCKDSDGYKYELRVLQEPRRARMCGFGDKDRRPITPPPCVRLIITDSKTGKERDFNSEVDHGMFVLNVDLWSPDGQREVNLVRHSQTSPSISLTTPISYGQVAGTPAFSNNLPGHGELSREVKFEHGGGPSYGNAPSFNPYNPQQQVNPYSQPQQPPSAYPNQYHPGYAQPATQPYPPQNGYAQPGMANQQALYMPGPQMHPSGNMGFEPQPIPSQQFGYPGGGRPFTPQDSSMQRLPVSSTQPGGMFTRNLIGSLAASAFRLTDPDDRIGIWFVLQDLSVRTEGNFRLRFSFVNVGRTIPDTSPGKGPNETKTVVNTGSAPVLASCFSEPFQVYSAKRFPGVVESTALSKCFATQGIKIPIRKEGQAPSTRASDRDEEYKDD
ncbi:hypothetical protein HYFRA_00010601 [Hymenoscyphus fraxineus]|uniref:Velvet domain-containing protein n=1 Tax=Hymenoscyphus fraxineus TaxID=746836 RepID=A0A9N9L9R3_9HELO|nr:hypothetical protein HYFRA_00010601 [Hymenoscyphus fraxineus]